ncbi:preprotein translocase subunit SecG [Desulfofalx alkaliphila]|uniref:preprotein translocase subunit SecG n=1 Tax=Desulfofalx alkaliphila TaxID=105483 RepID=UPI0004E10392|nr:preprotein translocase subunit SecG [Desulfofalx alkaliphila]
MLKGIIIGLQILLALGVIATVLLQSGKSAGLSGAIAGGAEQMFGRTKGLDEKLGKLTVAFSIIFAVLSLTLAAIW